MEAIESLKDRGTYYAVSKIVDLLSKASVDTFVNLTYWGEKLSRDPEVRGSISTIRQFLTDKSHPARDLFFKVFTTLSEYKRRRIFQSLFLNAWFLGGQKRDYYERECGFRPPFILILSPTLTCNLRCKGCYTLGYGTKPELTMELSDRILRECEELGIYFVTILGGEPMLYPPLFELIEGHPDIFFQIYTNGTLLTEEVARRLADYGNAAVVLSIDNPHVMREVINHNHPYFTHPGAEEIYTRRSTDMDAYAERYGILAERIWEVEYLHLEEAGQCL